MESQKVKGTSQGALTMPPKLKEWILGIIAEAAFL